MRRILLMAALMLSACTASNPIVDAEPPPAKVDEPTARPGADMYWRSGHYAWDGDKQIHYWINGTWEPSRPGYLWFPGEWEPVDDSGGQRLGWRWVDERWQRIDTLEELPPD